MGQFSPAIDAVNLCCISATHTANRYSRAGGAANDIGQVILALAINVVDFAKPGTKLFGGARHETRINFKDRALSLTGITLFNDCDYLIALITDDSTIPGGIAQLGSQQR